MEKQNVAAVGDRDSILLFRAMGVRTMEATEPQAIEKAIHRLAREGVAVIYLTENAAEQVGETLERYQSEPFPMIIPIPGRNGGNGFGMRHIHENMEKAIGSDIL